MTYQERNESERNESNWTREKEAAYMRENDKKRKYLSVDPIGYTLECIFALSIIYAVSEIAITSLTSQHTERMFNVPTQQETIQNEGKNKFQKGK
ncbi:hypothetical protein CMO96_01625 [Candidatus Woesebacteria bacterium]|nr:hypothetical protein [Candidatus Woesebacteria bacterium]|tara:strand:+ start:267 stop:551 length:285 start_codon:yes stop_codon:yes gene_type:complete